MTHAILMRPVTRADEKAYESLWYAGLTQCGDLFRIAIDDEQVLAIPTAFTDESFTLGAFAGPELLGTVSLERAKAARLRHKALIFSMFVHPNAQGQGVGRALLAHVLKSATGIAGLRQCFLTVLASNARAHRLYTSEGFRDFAREPESVRMNDRYIDEIQMVRFLR